jgi:hypothetical protein
VDRDRISSRAPQGRCASSPSRVPPAFRSEKLPLVRRSKHREREFFGELQEATRWPHESSKDLSPASPPEPLAVGVDPLIHSAPSGVGLGSGRSRIGSACRARPRAQIATIWPEASSVTLWTVTWTPRTRESEAHAGLVGEERPRPQPLPLVELGVLERCQPLDLVDHRRGKAGRLDEEPLGEHGVERLRSRLGDADPSRRARRAPTPRLGVGVGTELGVEEDGVALLPRFVLQGQRDQVAEAAAGQRVLAREEAISTRPGGLCENGSKRGSTAGADPSSRPSPGRMRRPWGTSPPAVHEIDAHRMDPRAAVDSHRGEVGKTRAELVEQRATGLGDLRGSFGEVAPAKHDVPRVPLPNGSRLRLSARAPTARASPAKPGATMLPPRTGFELAVSSASPGLAASIQPPSTGGRLA